MYIYTLAPPAGVTTNGSINTDTDHLRILTVSPSQCSIRSLYVHGRQGAATTITGISTYLKRFGTASTVGSAIVPVAADPTAPAAVTTPFTAPTIGSTPTILKLIGCGKSGPGAWTARDVDEEKLLRVAGAGNNNADLISQASEASMVYSYELQFSE
jgi:hypothetical protein